MAAALATIVCCPPAVGQEANLSDGWVFHRGDPADAAVAMNTDGWAPVSVPHDFSIDAGGGRLFTPDAPGAADAGYLRGGIGWYRRALDVNKNDLRASYLIRFGAAFMESEVWLNGARIHVNHDGYNQFFVDLTRSLRAGRNILAIRVESPPLSSRWYSGSGLIRPVTLFRLAPVHFDRRRWTVSTPLVSRQTGTIRSDSSLVNNSAKPKGVIVTTTVIDQRGLTKARSVSRHVISRGTTAIATNLSVSQPCLWSGTSPCLYRVRQTISDGKTVEDRHEVAIGFRRIEIDAKAGLRINGEPVKLNGANIHHDHYMLGAAGFPRAEERKLQLLKQAGFNAVRIAHNPASEATLEAADRLGMYVVNESFDAWRQSKRPKDYARFFDAEWRGSLDRMLDTSMNHPSVIMWSVGNEVKEQGSAAAVHTAKMLVAHIRERDRSRPVTMGVFVDEAENKAKYRNFQQLFDVFDVAGYNYGLEFYRRDLANSPDRLIMGTESYPARAFDYLGAVKANRSVIGDFVWTGFDYLGEAGLGWVGFARNFSGLGPFPWHLAYVGAVDATGAMTPSAYHRATIWGTPITPVSVFVKWPFAGGSLPNRDTYADPRLDWASPDLHPSWTWRGWEGKPIDVVVYSRLPNVQLVLNGQPIATSAISEAGKYQATFTIPYQPGVLEARAWNDAGVRGSAALRTSDAPTDIRVSADRVRLKQGEPDLVYLTAQLVDAAGRATYSQDDERELRWSVSGPGEMIGVGNGDPASRESLRGPSRRTFRGRLVGVLRTKGAPGRITVSFQGPGLQSRQTDVVVQ